MEVTEPKFYTVKEASRILKLHENTIYALISRGELHAVKVGSDWRIPASSLEFKTRDNGVLPDPKGQQRG